MNSREEIKWAQGDRSNHKLWAPPLTDRGGHCLGRSHLLLLVLLPGTSYTVIVATAYQCWLAWAFLAAFSSPQGLKIIIVLITWLT